MNTQKDKSTAAKSAHNLKLRIDHLWPGIILAAVCLYISLIPLPPNDFWWHLKIGEIIYTQRTIPATNLFAWTIPADKPFFYAAWLGELLIYMLYRLGDLELTIFTRNFLASATFWLVGYETRRRCRSWRITALSIALATLMSINVLIVRPQIWSWLPFVIFVFLLGRYAAGQLDGAWLLLCPAVMIFWVNVHGAFVLGLVLLGIYLFGESLRSLLKFPDARSWRQVGWLGSIALLTTLATIINPRSFHIFGYVVNLMTDQPSQRLIEEWQSPTLHGPANITFYISILLLLAVLAYSRFRPTPTDLLLVLAFLWLAWNGQRYVMWYGIVAMPILAQAVSHLPLKTPAFIPHRNWGNSLIAFCLIVPVLLVQPWFVENIPLPNAYWQQVLRDSPEGPLLSPGTPVAAGEYLKSHPGGNLFNEMGYGSYLIWACPNQSVFIDPRVELYPFQQWQDYIDINQGTNYNEHLDQYSANRILLDKQLQSKLATSLTLDPLWRLEYEDQRSQIWVKEKD